MKIERPKPEMTEDGRKMRPKRATMSEEFILIGWKANEILYYWRGTYWRWTRSPMVKDDPSHVLEELTDEHKEGWNLK